MGDKVEPRRDYITEHADFNKADKVVEVETADWKQYSIGDGVTVSVNEGLGLYAVLLAYILPALIIVGAVIAISAATHNELAAALIPILLTAIYFVVLYLCRNKLQRRFTFGIVKS